MKWNSCFIIILFFVIFSDIGCQNNDPNLEYDHESNQYTDGNIKDFHYPDNKPPKESSNEGYEKIEHLDNKEPKKCNEVKGALCSPGIRKYENGEYTECRQRVFKLAPSCLSEQDLNCDGISDKGVFGRTSIVQSIKNDKKYIFQKIMDVFTLNGKSYLLLLVEREKILSIELWVLNTENEKERSFVFIDSSNLHGKITVNNTFGRIFSHSGNEIYFSYCSKPDPISSAYQIGNYCKIVILNPSNYDMKSIEIEKTKKNTNILDTYISFNEEQDMHRLFTIEQIIDEKTNSPTTDSYLQVYQVNTQEHKIKYVSSSQEPIKIFPLSSSNHPRIFLKGKSSDKTIDIISFSFFFNEKINSKINEIWLTTYHVNDNKIDINNYKSTENIFLQGPVSISNDGWSVVFSGPESGNLTEISYKNDKWKESRIKGQNEGFFSGVFRNSVTLKNEHIMTAKSFYSSVSPNSSHKELYDSRVFISLFDRKNRKFYVLDIDRQPMAQSAILANASEDMKLFWLSSSKWILNEPRDRLNFVKIGFCDSKIEP